MRLEYHRMQNPLFLSGRRIAVFCLLALSLAFFLVRGAYNEYVVLHSGDFKQPYASARCLLEGCDPYNESDTHAAFLKAHGTEDQGIFVPYSALYPPFSLAALTPLAALPYPVAHLLWEATIAVSFTVAVLLTAELCVGFGVILPVALLAALVADSTILLMEGQVSGVVISLMVVGFWCLLRERYLPLAVLSLLLALLLKPHDAGLPLLYLLFAGPSWRRALRIIAVCFGVLALASTLWFSLRPASRHWLPELAANIQGNETQGNINDPTRGHTEALQTASLQAIVGAVDAKPLIGNALAISVTCALLLIWMVPAWRLENSLEKHVLAIAAISCMAVLPVYHRQYDTRLMLLAFPAASLIWRNRRRSWGLLSLVVLTAAIVCSAHQTLHRLEARHGAEIVLAGPLATLLRYRPMPEAFLLLALFFLAAFYAHPFTPSHEEPEAALPGARPDPHAAPGAAFRRTHFPRAAFLR